MRQGEALRPRHYCGFQPTPVTRAQRLDAKKIHRSLPDGGERLSKRVQRSCRAFALAPRWGAWTLRVQSLQIAAVNIISV